MWLFLDTHINGESRFGFLDGDHIDVQTYPGRANTLLAHIHARWTPTTMPIQGVCVVKGPGTFSAIRTGVLYANLISQIQKVPVVGIDVKQGLDLTRLSQQLADNQLPAEPFIAPIYDAAPNITTPNVTHA